MMCTHTQHTRPTHPTHTRTSKTKQHNTHSLMYALSMLKAKNNLIMPSAPAAVTLDGFKTTVKLSARSQGSVYVVRHDVSNATNQLPVVYQLDEWHLASHPARWPVNATVIEAEMFEGTCIYQRVSIESVASSCFLPRYLLIPSLPPPCMLTVGACCSTSDVMTSLLIRRRHHHY